jgi:hypothetical protein
VSHPRLQWRVAAALPQKPSTAAATLLRQFSELPREPTAAA